jgi:adenylate cyclase
MSLLNRRTQLKLKQLTIIIICWSAIGLLIAIYDHQVLHTRNSLGPVPQYSLPVSIALNMGIGLFSALAGGSLLVFYVNVKYQDKSYGYTILVVAISFLAIIALIMGILKVIAMPDMQRMIKNTVVWALVVAMTQLMLQINSKFGYGIFWDIIRGKYNTPKQERRIFMFLDLNASTTIAEQLGDTRYHEFLKDFFKDITNPILNNKGEIYQYVGDEVVVAWKYEEGIDNGRCVQCFFDIKDHISGRKEKYLSQYQLMPTFKAGIHCGDVIAGEIGIIKRDITYSGDVLNTTARIQAMCKQFNAEIIASADLLAELGTIRRYASQTLGAIKLRGKQKEMMLVALKPLPKA